MFTTVGQKTLVFSTAVSSWLVAAGTQDANRHPGGIPSCTVAPQVSFVWRGIRFGINCQPNGGHFSRTSTGAGNPSAGKEDANSIFRGVLPLCFFVDPVSSRLANSQATSFFLRELRLDIVFRIFRTGREPTHMEVESRKPGAPKESPCVMCQTVPRRPEWNAVGLSLLAGAELAPFRHWGKTL